MIQLSMFSENSSGAETGLSSEFNNALNKLRQQQNIFVNEGPLDLCTAKCWKTFSCGKYELTYCFENANDLLFLLHHDTKTSFAILTYLCLNSKI